MKKIRLLGTILNLSVYSCMYENRSYSTSSYHTLNSNNIYQMAIKGHTSNLIIYLIYIIITQH